MVICLERGADLHTAQLMLLPLTVSCSSKIQIGFTFLVPAHLGGPGERAVKRVCVCVCVWIKNNILSFSSGNILLMFLLNAVTRVDVPIDSGKDLGQHWPSFRSSRYGPRQLHQGICHRLLSLVLLCV